MNNNITRAQKLIKKTILNKLFFTMFAVLFFCLGRSIPLVGLNLTKSQIVPSGTLFSLGMTPWMTTLILFRAINLADSDGSRLISIKNDHFFKMMVLILISLLQAGGVLFQLSTLGQYNIKEPIIFSINILLMTVGALLTSWLSQMISQHGLGGMSLLVAFTIIGNSLPIIVNVLRKIMLMEIKKDFIICILILSYLVFVTFFFKSEYKIKYYQINYSTSVDKYSYIPIKLLPALGMPFMYVTSLVTFFDYFLVFISGIARNLFFLNFAKALKPGTHYWNIILLSLIFLTSIGFAFFNVNTQELSERMEKSGDFIATIIPGRNTQKYLNKLVFLIGLFGAFINIAIIIVPMFLIQFAFGLKSSDVSAFGGIYLMLLAIYSQGHEQINTLAGKYQYKLEELQDE